MTDLPAFLRKDAPPVKVIRPMPREELIRRYGEPYARKVLVIRGEQWKDENNRK